MHTSLFHYHRKNVLQLYKGDKNFIPEQFELTSASILVCNLDFSNSRNYCLSSFFFFFYSSMQ